MKILWLTDVHVNFLKLGEAACAVFAETLNGEGAEAVVISGDIAEAYNVKPLLSAFAEAMEAPVYFVLGNHDYYKGSFESVREEMESGLPDNLHWLDRAEPVMLDDETALAGHQGWFDARYGNAMKSRVALSDFSLIEDLRPHFNRLSWEIYADEGSRDALLAKVREVSAQAAKEARVSLEAALKARDNAIFVTHFPPYDGACWHQGALSDPHWMPWFTSKAMGDMLDEVSAAHPDSRILVLCGHTHSEGIYVRNPNLRVLTGKARYGHPDLASVIETPLAPWD